MQENIFVTLGYTKRSPKLQNNNKKKINWASLKFKTLTIPMTSNKKMKIQETYWEKMFSKHISNKGLCPEYTDNTQNSIIMK